MPGDLHHLRTTSTISERPPPSPDLHRQGTRAVQNVAPPLGASPRPPKTATPDTPHPPPTHTGNVGVMTNTSTQPIGNALIDSILHQR